MLYKYDILIVRKPPKTCAVAILAVKSLAGVNDSSVSTVLEKYGFPLGANSQWDELPFFVSKELKMKKLVFSLILFSSIADAACRLEDGPIVDYFACQATVKTQPAGYSQLVDEAVQAAEELQANPGSLEASAKLMTIIQQQRWIWEHTR